jgi:pyruvate/2-oxoglutarate dehydrogenase complex dihydrolipoamide acyltransferase (E2) component
VKVIENEIKARRMMSVVFSSDTLVVDMGQAAQFLSAIQRLIESGLAGHLTDEELALANA